jgi:hypothetical protein
MLQFFAMHIMIPISYLLAELVQLFMFNYFASIKWTLKHCQGLCMRVGGKKIATLLYIMHRIIQGQPTHTLLLKEDVQSKPTN